MKKLSMQLDTRSREDMIHQMEELAASYTPEWKYHAQNPDVGSALISIYADMLAAMLQQYNQAPERDRSAFFQCMETVRKPAEAARGYVSFGMVRDAGAGAPVPAGTVLLGKNEQGESIKVETQKDIFVSTAKIKAVYATEGSRDRVERLAEEEGMIAGGFQSNLQEHSCLLGHSTIFSVTGETELQIAFTPGRENQNWDEVIGNPVQTGFSYFSELGEWEFREWSCNNHIIHLKKTKEMPDFTTEYREDKRPYMIRWQAKDIEAYAGLEIKDIVLGASGSGWKPEEIYTAESVEGSERYFPFGERPYVYGEFYVCSGEVLGKKGASVSLRFDMEFRRISQLIEPEAIPIHWKTVMKPSDFAKEKVLPITIGEVVWEYYNGTGFTRLFAEPLYSDIFMPPETEEEGTEPGDLERSKAGMPRTVEMNLTCPMDIQPFLVNAKQVYCIRARILRMNHAYVRNGYYLTPFISKMKLSYHYRNEMQKPEFCCIRNNLEEHWIQGCHGFVPFRKLESEKKTVYIGFDQPLREGPYGLYCGVPERNFERYLKQWNYEYFDGKGWKSLLLEDDTERLQKCGTWILFGNKEMEKKQLFGTEWYWIRIISGEDVSRKITEPDCKENSSIRLPVQELWWNTVPVLALTCGEQGNLMTGQIHQLSRSIRFINQVVNRHPLTGGKNSEKEEEAVRRISRSLRHQDRAVMTSDYEALAFEASRDVARAKAYANRNSEGEQAKGRITLVVLQENYQEVDSDFQSLREQIMESVLKRMPGIPSIQQKFSVIEPWFTEIQVSVVCVLLPHASVFVCREEIERQLNIFLNPMTGNFDGQGWEIGMAPKREQIRNAIRRCQSVEAVKKLVVKAYCNRGREIQEIDLEGNIPEYVVVVNGSHHIQFECF